MNPEVINAVEHSVVVMSHATGIEWTSLKSCVKVKKLFAWNKRNFWIIYIPLDRLFLGYSE